jgi:hypothetical protein
MNTIWSILSASADENKWFKKILVREETRASARIISGSVPAGMGAPGTVNPIFAVGRLFQRKNRSRAHQEKYSDSKGGRCRFDPSPCLKL